MIIASEDGAPGIVVGKTFKRTLKVLLSPVLHPELTEISVGFSIIPPGSKFDVHCHIEGELFFVCSGSGIISVSEEKEDIRPDTVIWVPKMKLHGLINNGKDILKILWVLCPPGREAEIIDKYTKKNKIERSKK